jgi:small subunit ribosomal protein S20
LPAKASASKRHRQSLNRRMRNKMVRTRVRTSTRKLAELLEAKSTEEAAKQYNTVASLLDRAVSKGVIDRNTAARKKHRLHKMLSGAKAAS